jgi:hypothetical protein
MIDTFLLLDLSMNNVHLGAIVHGREREVVKGQEKTGMAASLSTDVLPIGPTQNHSRDVQPQAAIFHFYSHCQPVKLPVEIRVGHLIVP